MPDWQAPANWKTSGMNARPTSRQLSGVQLCHTRSSRQPETKFSAANSQTAVSGCHHGERKHNGLRKICPRFRIGIFTPAARTAAAALFPQRHRLRRTPRAAQRTAGYGQPARKHGRAGRILPPYPHRQIGRKQRFFAVVGRIGGMVGLRRAGRRTGGLVYRCGQQNPRACAKPAMAAKLGDFCAAG